MSDDVPIDIVETANTLMLAVPHQDSDFWTIRDIVARALFRERQSKDAGRTTATRYRADTPEGGVIRLEQWPEGHILWHHGQIVWKSYGELKIKNMREVKLEGGAIMLTDGLPIDEGNDDVGPLCELCGCPMPAGEEMFKFHGYSGPCPQPAVEKDAAGNE